MLNRFERGTGQKLSPAKCSLLARGSLDDQVKEEIRETLGVERVEFEPKYLGLPTPEGRQKKDRFQPLRERLGKRMADWSEKHLSVAAKEVLIKAVAQAIPTYTMSIFHLSDTCEELTRSIRNYWWGAEGGARKTHWIAWEKFTRCKARGGLGFRDLRVFNQALLARQAWRLIEYPDSLCARLLKAKYFPNGDLLDTVFPTQVSPTWKALMHGLELLKQGAIWRVADGSKIKIWRHQWLPREWSLRPSRSKRPCRLKWVSQLIDAQTREWNIEVLQRFFHDYDFSEIIKIKIPRNVEEDFVAWHYEKTGCFSVRGAYRLGIDLRDHGKIVSTNRRGHGERLVWKKLWGLPVPQKVKVFAWRVVHNGLATQENKKIRRMETQNTCGLCGGVEDVHHAVLLCPHARSLRQAMREKWPLPREEDLHYSGHEWLLRIIDKYDADIVGRLVLILWRSWFIRNELTNSSRKLYF